MLTHDKENNRFLWKENENMPFAQVNYRIQDGKYLLWHSEIPHELRGKGMGRTMVTAVFQYLKDHNLKAIPQCSYILHIAMRNPQFRDIFN